MLTYIHAKLIEAQPQHVVVQVMGLGIQVLIPASLYFELPSEGEEIVLYTTLQVKEDGPTLYGFRTAAERDFFEILRRVSGIGPKAALSVLGHLSLNELYKALKNEDYQSLTSIPGIGVKTARRIVYELREKVEEQKIDIDALEPAVGAGENIDNWSDVQEALLTLGYTSQEVNRAKKNLSHKLDSSVDLLFKEALNFLSSE